MSIWQEAKDWSSNQCSIVLIAENNFSGFHQFDISFSNQNMKYFYPAVLKWEIGNKSCHETQKRGDYACGRNSHCINSKKGSGYRCLCNPGYRGNPYLPDGCIGMFLYSWLGIWMYCIATTLVTSLIIGDPSCIGFFSSSTPTRIPK